MGALAPWHWVVLIVVIFLIFGGRILPRLGRSLGQSITGMKHGLKQSSEEFKSAMAKEDESPKPGSDKADGVDAPRGE